MDGQQLPRMWEGPAAIGKIYLPLMFLGMSAVLEISSPDLPSMLIRLVFAGPAFLAGLFFLLVPGQMRLHQGEIKFRRAFTWRTIPRGQIESFSCTAWFRTIELRGGRRLRYFGEPENMSPTISGVQPARAESGQSEEAIHSHSFGAVRNGVLFVVGAAAGGGFRALTPPQRSMAEGAGWVGRLMQFEDAHALLFAAIGLGYLSIVLLRKRVHRPVRSLLWLCIGGISASAVADLLVSERMVRIGTDGTTADLILALGLSVCAVLAGLFGLFAPAMSAETIGWFLGARMPELVRGRHLYCRVVGCILVLTGVLIASFAWHAFTRQL